LSKQTVQVREELAEGQGQSAKDSRAYHQQASGSCSQGHGTDQQNHAIVCLEKLQIRNMTRSSRGGVGSVDRNARRKAALNRAILQQNWFEFRRQLAYKLAWRGGRLILVSPRYTSRTCPQCGTSNQRVITSS
jgi:IS605 OrfB family transposase